MKNRSRKRASASLVVAFVALATMGVECPDDDGPIPGPFQGTTVRTEILADISGSGSGRVMPQQPILGFHLNCRIANGALDLGTSTCSESFPDAGGGGTFELEATAEAGSVFAGWTDCKPIPATNASCACTGTGFCVLTFDGGADPTFMVTARFDLDSPPPLACSDPARSTIADAALADADWTDQIIFDSSVGQPAAFASSQDQNEGNPAPARSTDHSYCGDGVNTNAGIIVAHWHDMMFDPGNQSAAFLSFAFDMRFFPWQAGSTADVALRALVHQGDSFYEGPSMEVEAGDLQWVTYNGSCLVPQDFVRRLGTGPSLPDFSLPMQFGYATANSTPNPGCQMRTSYVDNWSVEVR